jgi:YfiH family protein
MNPDWIVPRWPAPAGVHALCTTRTGGVSTGPWKSLNLGLNSGDDASAVRKNRALLSACLPAEPYWLRQQHGVTVFRHGRMGGTPVQAETAADAQVAGEPRQVCVVLSADCLPVLMCNRSGTRVAAAHAGWRGLAAGILENTVQALKTPPDQLMAWLGPAIGPRVYEVGDEVRSAFISTDEAAAACFGKTCTGWLLDMYAMARHRLNRSGVSDVSGGDFCTYSEPERFFSYRRDGVTGRMASLVWLGA